MIIIVHIILISDIDEVQIIQWGYEINWYIR
jgi:hypothetical protein